MKTIAGKIVACSGIWLLATCLVLPLSGFRAAISAPAISGVRADFTTNASCNICWATDQPATSQVEYWETGTGNTVRTPEDSGLVASHTVVLSGLDAGSAYRYRVASRDGGGNQSLSPEAAFTTTAARAGSSEYYGQWANGLPDGEDFFPLAVWLQSPGNAPEFKGIGINTFVGLWQGPTEAQLGSLNAQGIYTVASQNAIGLTSPNNAVVRSWLHQDEPDNAQWNEGTSSWGPCVAPGVLIDLYKGWKAADGSRPVMLNFGQGVSNMGSDGMGWYGRWYLDDIGGKDYSVPSGNYSLYYTEASEGADIIAYDIYPVTSPDSWVSGRLEYVSQGVHNLVDWTGGRKQVWNCIETTHIDNATARPTPAQIRSEVWMSLIAGSSGIVYFVHEWQPSFREDGIFRYDDAAAAVAAVNSEITALAPVLNSPTLAAGAAVTSSVPVDVMVKEHGGYTYLFASSLGSGATAAALDVAGLDQGTVEVLGEGRQLIMAGGTFQDDFAGYGVHLYRISPIAVTVPDAPSGLQANPVTSTRIDLDWADNSDNEGGFRIERAPDSGGAAGTFAEAAYVGPGATSWSDTGLAPGTTYYYRVCAYNAGGDSAYSNTVQAATPAEPPEPEKTTLFFAEGYTGEGFVEYLCLGNPGAEDASAAITYLFPDGSTQGQEVEVPALSRATVCVNDQVGAGREVSVKVESDRPIVAERPIYFSYQGRWTGGHDTVAAASTSRDWYFAEGYTGEGFDEYICVLNPGDAGARLAFTFLTQEEGPVLKEGFEVPAHSRATFKVNDVLGTGYQASLSLSSDQPVVAERPMYFNYRSAWDGGHCVMGASSLAREYFFAEGTTRDGFEEWLAIQNPDPTGPISVHATYQFGPGQGGNLEKDYIVERGRRSTIFVPDEAGREKDVSIRLTSEDPFLAERPMYFNYHAAWDGGHCVIGASAAAEEWFFSEGYTGDGFHTWLCLQNPGSDEAVVEVTYLTPSGPLEKKRVSVPALSRLTIAVNEHAGGGLELSCRLRVVSGPGIVAERPMYFNYNGAWDGGHDVVGF